MPRLYKERTMAYFMEKMSVRDLEQALTKTKTIIIPVGIVEQHGYHLPLSTDILNAIKPLEIGADRLDAVIAPSVNYCYSGGELLGTVNVSPNTFGLYMTEICEEFIKMGFVNIIVYMGHGGTENKACLQNSLQMMLRRDHKKAEKITVAMVECCHASPTWMTGFDLEPEHDFHAGMMETSLMLYWAPELVQDEIVMDDEPIASNMRKDCDWFEIKEKNIDHPDVVPHAKQREEIKVGVMGLPERADRALGEKICNEIIDYLVDLIEKMQTGRK